jgi:hypothetical protein
MGLYAHAARAYGHMDEKTAELRDIFISVADEETVTESQNETPGSLSQEDIAERLAGAVTEMRETESFATTLDTDPLVAVVRGFYEGRSDADLAEELGVSRDTVVRARMDLHLLRDADFEAPFDMTAFRDAKEADVTTLAERFDVAMSTARRYRRALTTRERILEVNDRYRDEFETILQDPELSARHTTQESGLEGATEDQEVDVSL